MSTLSSSRRTATAFHPPPLTVADLPRPLQNAFMATVGNGKPLGMAKAQKVLKIELDGASLGFARKGAAP